MPNEQFFHLHFVYHDENKLHSMK